MSTQRQRSSIGDAPADNIHDNCCCGSIHVETGAAIVAVIGVVLSVMLAFNGAFWPFTDAPPTVKRVIAIAGFLGLIVYACVLVAQRVQVPALYLPYLALYGAWIVSSLAGILFVVCVCIVMPDAIFAYFPPDHKAHLRVVISLVIVVQLALTAVPVWFEWVVYKAYKCMKKRLMTPPSSV